MICGLQNRLFSRLIQEVRRPGRYSDNEINFPYKLDGRLRFLLCFPDLYDIGMSNLGLRILYHVVNRHPDMVADMAFAPWPDMEAFMRANGMPLSGLGTGMAAREFSVLGFSLQHELQYANVLTMLDLAGIPLKAADRTREDPLVIAGGPCAFNPEPMRDFIDAFAVGDGETVSVEIGSAVLDTAGGANSRTGLLERLAEIEGVYVPLVHEPERSELRIRRRVEPELKEEDFPLPPIVPIAPITHDRLTVEIMRGCTRGCRFCSAGMLGRPVRERSAASVVRLAERGIAESGWEEVSLVSLSTSDHSGLEAMVRGMTRVLHQRRVSISLPSMRPGTFSENVAALIAGTKRTGLTFAPEAGTDRLRRAINKNVDEDELYATIEMAFKHGWDAIKLYFMIGLPTETDEDAEAMVKMVRSVESICRVYGRRKRITVSLSPFVPRPHTPFQWQAQQRPEEALGRISYLRKNLPDRRIRLKWRDPYMAHLEGLLARGDRRVGNVVLRAWRAGARFDSWSDKFDYILWQAAFEAEGLSLEDVFAGRERGSPVPWGYIDGGVSRDFLLAEATKSEAGKLTPDCRTGACSDCGACPGPRTGEGAEHPEEISAMQRQADRISAGPPVKPMPGSIGRAASEDVRIRYRVRFAKREDMVLASHLDVVRAIQRGMRRAALPLSFSRGFSPHPRMSFGPPLPLGVLGESEYFDVFFSRPPESGWEERVNACLPKGLHLIASHMIAQQSPSLVKVATTAAYRVVIWHDGTADSAGLAKQIEEGLPGGSQILGVDSPGKGDTICVEIRARLESGTPRPEKVLDEVLRGVGVYYRLIRTELYNEKDGVLNTPFEV